VRSLTTRAILQHFCDEVCLIKRRCNKCQLPLPLVQSWNQHFFVLTGTHLYYTEEQQQDVTDGDDVATVDEEVCCVIFRFIWLRQMHKMQTIAIDEPGFLSVCLITWLLVVLLCNMDSDGDPRLLVTQGTLY